MAGDIHGNCAIRIVAMLDLEFRGGCFRIDIRIDPHRRRASRAARVAVASRLSRRCRCAAGEVTVEYGWLGFAT
jgi:hypothetical protein